MNEKERKEERKEEGKAANGREEGALAARRARDQPRGVRGQPFPQRGAEGVPPEKRLNTSD